MFTLLSLCLVILPTLTLSVESDAKRPTLSPSDFAKLIQEHNPEGYTMVECVINDLILIIQTRPDWAPLGQKRFIQLVNDRYYDGAALFRAIKDFIVQFGLASTKAMRDKWAGQEAQIQDDPHNEIPFTRGVMSFAGSGKNTRGTQIFFTLAEHSSHLGKEAWEVPFGKVIYGDDTLKSINTEYDDNVSQGKIWKNGYEYLRKEHPNLSYIRFCRTINEHEISYYLQSAKKQQVEDEKQQKFNNELLNQDKQHDLEQQLYGNNGSISDDVSVVLIFQVIGGVVCIGGIIFIVVKLLKKTPDKNN